MWTQEFLNKLIAKDIDGANNLRYKNLPSSLFKYRSVNLKSIENLRNDTIWISSADKFDDPYDCFYTIQFDKFLTAKAPQIMGSTEILELNKKHNNFLTNDKINRIIKSPNFIEDLANVILTKNKNLAIADRKRMIGDLKSVFNEIFEDYLINEFRYFIRKNTGICCFSETMSSMVMWRYYGDNHKGFCIEYKLTKIDINHPLVRCLFPVVYTVTLPDMTAQFTKDEKDFNSLFGVIAAMHKSEEWRYEREWRIILPFGEKDCSFNFKMPKPKAIYIGIKTPLDQRILLQDIAKQKEIETFLMEFDCQSYKLRAQPLLS